MNSDLLLSLVALGLVALTAWRKLRSPSVGNADPRADFRRLLVTWHEEQREQQKRSEDCLRAVKALVEQAAQLQPKP